MGKHRPKEGSWIPDPKRKGSFTIVGKITKAMIDAATRLIPKGRG